MHSAATVTQDSLANNSQKWWILFTLVALLDVRGLVLRDVTCDETRGFLTTRRAIRRDCHLSHFPFNFIIEIGMERALSPCGNNIVDTYSDRKL